MSTATVFEKSVCLGYQTRVFSVTRDAGTTAQTRTRKEKVIQQVIDPCHVQTFGALKQEAYRQCRAAGTKFELLDVWIIPEENEADLAKRLINISLKWDDYRDNTLVPNYDDWIEQQCRENPLEAKDIRRLAPPIAEIQRQTRFVFASFRLDPGNIKAINLEEETGGLADQAVREIAADIKDAGMHKSQAFSQQSREVLRRIARKAKSLAYLHPRLQQIADVVGDLMQSLPVTGKIVGIDALAMRSVLDSLLEPSKFMQRGFGTDGASQDAADDDDVDQTSDAVTQNETIADAVSHDLAESEPQPADAQPAAVSADWNW